ncbi:MAG: hypothetical protein KC619_22795 [Myxococcales bacterium]|nr:hypothetical protein [Myxococcales bacterium]
MTEAALGDDWWSVDDVDTVVVELRAREGREGAAVGQLRCGRTEATLAYEPPQPGMGPTVPSFGRAYAVRSRVGWDGRPRRRAAVRFALPVRGPVSQVRLDGVALDASEATVLPPEQEWTRLDFVLPTLGLEVTAGASFEEDWHELSFVIADQGPRGCPLVLRRRYLEMEELVAGHTSCAFFREGRDDWPANDELGFQLIGVFQADPEPDWRRAVNYPNPLCVQSPWWLGGPERHLWLGGRGDTLMRIDYRPDPQFVWYCGLLGLLSTLLFSWARSGRRVRGVMWSCVRAAGRRTSPGDSWEVLSLNELEGRIEMSSDDSATKVRVVGWGRVSFCRANRDMRVWRPGHGWQETKSFRITYGACVLVGPHLLVFADAVSSESYTVRGVRSLFNGEAARWPSTWRRLAVSGPFLGLLTALVALCAAYGAGHLFFYPATRDGFVLMSLGTCVAVGVFCRVVTIAVRRHHRISPDRHPDPPMGMGAEQGVEE